jgi:5'-3' exonuclease
VASLLLDTASLYYRSYFALPETMTAPDGTPVNAVRGVLDTITGCVEARSSDRVIACWDEDWRPEWRVALVPTYKTHRVAEPELDESPDEDVPDTLAPQIDILRALLPALGVPIAGTPHCEADDVIADLATSLTGPVDIVSGDRDLVQLVTDRVTLLYTGGTSASRGGKPWLVIDPSSAAERFGVPPQRYADLAILRGDPSDGLPGAKGIGDKTAGALLSHFGDLAGVLAAAQDPSTGKPMTPAVRARLLAAREGLAAAEQVVRLAHAPGRTPIPAPRPPDDSSWDLARSWGVEPQARRLVAAFQAVAP